MVILLPIIWTSQLASGIKAALTVTICLFALLAGVGQGIYALVSLARQMSDTVSRTGSSRSLVSD